MDGPDVYVALMLTMMVGSILGLAFLIPRYRKRGQRLRSRPNRQRRLTYLQMLCVCLFVATVVAQNPSQRKFALALLPVALAAFVWYAKRSQT